MTSGQCSGPGTQGEKRNEMDTLMGALSSKEISAECVTTSLMHTFGWQFSDKSDAPILQHFAASLLPSKELATAETKPQTLHVELTVNSCAQLSSEYSMQPSTFENTAQ